VTVVRDQTCETR